MIYLTADNTNLAFLPRYERLTGERGNLTLFTPKSSAWWLGLQLFFWGYHQVLAVSTRHLWGYVRCACFLDYSGIILPMGGEEKRGWKGSLLGLGDAPANAVGTSTSLPTPMESLGLAKSCTLLLGQMCPLNPGPNASNSLEVLIQSIQKHFPPNQRVKQGICNSVVMIDKPWQSI